MKSITNLNAAVVIAAFSLMASVGHAADNKSEKLKPYPLETCVVSGEKLGEMGKPFVYQHEGRCQVHQEDGRGRGQGQKVVRPWSSVQRRSGRG